MKNFLADGSAMVDQSRGPHNPWYHVKLSELKNSMQVTAYFYLFWLSGNKFLK